MKRERENEWMHEGYFSGLGAFVFCLFFTLHPALAYYGLIYCIDNIVYLHINVYKISIHKNV